MTGASPDMTPRRVALELAIRMPIATAEVKIWANAIEKALHDQIEACAKVAELPVLYAPADRILDGDTCDFIASAIRAMKGSKP